jgi:hypothetical protein
VPFQQLLFGQPPEPLDLVDDDQPIAGTELLGQPTGVLAETEIDRGVEQILGVEGEARSSRARARNGVASRMEYAMLEHPFTTTVLQRRGRAARAGLQTTARSEAREGHEAVAAGPPALLERCDVARWRDGSEPVAGWIRRHFHSPWSWKAAQ